MEIERTAYTTPALGYNFIARQLGKTQRKHIHVPDLLAPVFAHTLFVRAQNSHNPAAAR
jgi:hypothetical protein